LTRESVEMKARAPTLAVAALLAVSLMAPAWAQGKADPTPGAVTVISYEDLPRLKASDILPKELLSGPNHRVAEDVTNDGYLNTYILTSPFGAITTVATASVRIRIRELNAIAAMEKVQKSDAFAQAAKSAAQGAYKGAKNIVTQPVETLKGAVTGVGSFFARAAQATRLHEKSDAEDPGYKAVIGFSDAKREVAAEFGVDVYSSNKLLQERLEDLAWTQFAGDITFKAPLALVSGGVGVAVSTSQTITALNELVTSTPPQDLRIRNHEKLEGMGIHEDVVDLFMENGTFTPRQQTVIVEALDRMPQTANRGAFIKFAVPTETEDLAFFRQRMAALFAAYDRKVEPVTEFVALGRFIAGRTKSGAVMLIVPVDYLVWTRNTADVVAALDAQIAALTGVTAKHIWVDKPSSRSRKELVSRGWNIHENSEEELFGK
jgi:hypothetical protein